MTEQEVVSIMKWINKHQEVFSSANEWNEWRESLYKYLDSLEDEDKFYIEIKDLFEKHVGTRCPEVANGCHVCEMYAILDLIRLNIA